MERLARSDDTPAGKIATERLIAAALDPDRYPDGTAFIPADADDVEAMLTSSFAERRPVAIIYPDGREMVATPEAGVVAWSLLLLARVVTGFLRRRRLGRDQLSAPSVEVPRTYRVEIRRERVAA
jgi:hypothetical protein